MSELEDMFKFMKLEAIILNQFVKANNGRKRSLGAYGLK